MLEGSAYVLLLDKGLIHLDRYALVGTKKETCQKKARRFFVVVVCLFLYLGKRSCVRGGRGSHHRWYLHRMIWLCVWGYAFSGIQEQVTQHLEGYKIYLVPVFFLSLSIVLLLLFFFLHHLLLCLFYCDRKECCIYPSAEHLCNWMKRRRVSRSFMK